MALLSTAFLVHFNAPQFFSELPPAKVSSESEGRQRLGLGWAVRWGLGWGGVWRVVWFVVGKVTRDKA